MVKRKTKKVKKLLSPDEKKLRREQSAFRRKIQSAFKNMGFEYLKVDGIDKRFGFKKGELDSIFLFENIILICEDTVTKTGDKLKSHLKNKHILFTQLDQNRDTLLKWLKDDFTEKFNKFEDYSVSKYKVFNLYISKNKIGLSDDDLLLYNNMTFIEEDILNYFHKMSSNIKYSSINELYRFLKIEGSEIGFADSGDQESRINTTIISPEDNTGLKSNARVISFMMSAEKLMKNAYVLRKDNWEESSGLYQRLIEKGRIESIRKFLAKNKETFINNIIVSLPENITFRNKDDDIVELENITDFNGYKMNIPDELNSICIIDGQHRIYAHYKGNDQNEVIIKKLRKKLYLLVTGLIFPKEMTLTERRKFESEMFLNINSNSKPVPQDVLLHIETLKDPFSSLGIARNILEKLNKKHPFKDLFQLSLMRKAKIKIPSIIKFALKYVVEINPDKETYFKYWENQDKNILLDEKHPDREKLLSEYSDFVTERLYMVFSALYNNFKSDWYDEDSKILSTTSINGFLIGIRETLKYGIKDFDFYDSKFKKFNKDLFKKDSFPYISSQYNKFAQDIIKIIS